MKIYTKVVIDMATGRIIEYDSYEYTGPIAECKGGSQSTTSVDKVYNARMAVIAEAQQAMAEEYMEFWRTDYKPMEEAQIAANIGLIPEQVETERTKMEAERKVLPAEAEYRVGMMEAGTEELAMAKPVMAEYYKEALRGGDVEGEVSRARADVAGAYAEQAGAQRREMGRFGIAPGSERMAAGMQDRRMEQARTTAGAMTGARRFAEERGFQRLAGAAQTFKGGIGGRA